MSGRALESICPSNRKWSLGQTAFLQYYVLKSSNSSPSRGMTLSAVLLLEEIFGGFHALLDLCAIVWNVSSDLPSPLLANP